MKHMKLIALLVCLTVIVCSFAGCAKTAALSFELNGGAASDLPAEFTNNAELALPTPTRDYYKFDGWSLNSDLSGDLLNALPAEMELTDEQVEGGLKLYAAWTRLTAKINYDLQGGAWAEGDTPVTEYKYGEVTDIDLEPERENFEFDCWTLNGEEVESILANQTGDVTLVAVWTQVKTEIEFVLGDVEGAKLDDVDDAKDTFKTDDGCELGDYIPEAPGYIFTGWFLTAEDAADETAEPVTFIDDGTTEKVTVYARWAKAPDGVTGGDDTWVPEL